MRSQLTDANISDINGGDWIADYIYHDNGDMSSRTIQSNTETFSYTGHQMTDADGNSLSWDENGNLTTGVSTSLVWNWDDKLRSATKAGTTINLKYDPSGNRIYKDSGGTARKYIVDPVGDLPVILLELDSSNNIKKTYIYANSQIIAQHNGDHSASRYFYLHDRLGSVRQVIDTSGDVKNVYVYQPFGKLFATETTENVTNPFKFTGQFFDSEIDEYYLRARQFDPHIGRFTSRDPIKASYERPLSLHVYLYCENDPLNNIDLNGLWREGIRYALREGEYKVADAYSLSDEEILSNKNWKKIWNTEWHGHSDFGYLQGDLDYTTLDYIKGTRPVRDFPFGTSLHFRSLGGAFGAEFYVGLALRSGDARYFEQAMHMGQDYFSHRGKGQTPASHAWADIRGHSPDNPYSGGKQLDSAYKNAQRWTKQFEEVWYLIWDTDTWLSLP